MTVLSPIFNRFEGASENMHTINVIQFILLSVIFSNPLSVGILGVFRVLFFAFICYKHQAYLISGIEVFKVIDS